jgi:hypothetical protein
MATKKPNNPLFLNYINFILSTGILIFKVATKKQIIILIIYKKNKGKYERKSNKTKR